MKFGICNTGCCGIGCTCGNNNDDDNKDYIYDNKEEETPIIIEYEFTTTNENNFETKNKKIKNTSNFIKDFINKTTKEIIEVLEKCKTAFKNLLSKLKKNSNGTIKDDHETEPGIKIKITNSREQSSIFIPIPVELQKLEIPNLKIEGSLRI